LEPTRISTFILGGGHPFLRSADTNDAVIGELQQGIGRFYELWEQLAGSVSEVERQAILANDPDALIACLLADRVERGWDWGLGRMTMPCLVFAGELDAPTRDLAQQAATAMPQATFLSLQGCDHSSAAEPNDPLLSRMRSLLSSAG
jgi:pimeloyl-ACP methyl ester carboxylesterase